MQEKDNPYDLELIRKELMRSSMRSSGIVSTESKASPIKSSDDESKSKLQRDKFLKGYETLIGIIKEREKLGVFRASDETEEVQVEACILSKESLEKIGKLENWEKWIQTSTYLQGLFGFSNEVMLNFYEVAVNLQFDKRFLEAENAFCFLCALNDSIQAFWIAMGISFEGVQKYGEAIDAFKRALELEPTDFGPFLGMIRVCGETKDYEIVKELLKSQLENEEIKEQVVEALEMIESFK